MRRPSVAAVATVLVGVLAAGTTACAPGATVDPAATEESYAHLRTALTAYRDAGFLAGPAEFPVVGRPLVLPGPGDSAWVGFVASLPPSALRFAREDGLVAARYQVTMLATSGTDTLARVDRREVVRVESFAETTSREPRVLFQRFVLVPARPLTLEVRVRELTSRREAKRSFALEVRNGLSQPVVAYRAAPRADAAERPDVLSYARNTVTATEARPVVLLEDADGPEGPVLLAVERAGARVWVDTVVLSTKAAGPATAVAALPVHLLPPGTARLTARRLAAGGTTAAAPLYVGLSPEWVLPTWDGSLSLLAYALDSDTLKAWRAAAPGEQATLWRRFQERTDPDPETAANEYLAGYLERMTRANGRFDEPGRAGWETDRGEVLVKLGEPDRQRFIRPEREGEVPRIEWEYEESVPTSALIVFEDAGEFGVFVMTPRSRLALRRVVDELAAAGRGPATDDG